MLWEEAWNLCDASSEYAKKAAREIGIQEMAEQVFLPSSLVDVERTKRDSGNPPTKIYLKSPHGEFHSETKNWIPFRHGDVQS